jgi:hypothetical protein
MSAVVLRRITMAGCFCISWAMALGISAAATASPRYPHEMGVPLSKGSASVPSQSVATAQYRAARGHAAASDRSALTTASFRRRNSSKALYRSGEHSVTQISPTILRRSDPSLEDDGHPPCRAKARRRSGCYQAKSMRPKDLADALLEAPSPATEHIFKDIGIPAIKDVPPIAILRSGHPGVDENFAAELR